MNRAALFVAVAGLALAVPVLAENRTVDGSANNLSHPWMGQTGSLLLRSPAGCEYADGVSAMMARPNPRDISNGVADQQASGLGNARNLSSMAWQWGQFIDHDFALVGESSESANFAIPMGDPVFDPYNTGTAEMPFVRSIYSGGTGPGDPRQHANEITHWIDGSNVYGSDATRASALRAPGGKLATSAGDFLPYNTGGLDNAGGPGANMFLAGDIRSNEQSGLTAMHTVFVREHNRLAHQISFANPGWSDDQVYEKARKLVGAEIQAITYNEWLPSMMGGDVIGSYAGYDENADGSIDTAFSTAAFRIGHTMLNDELLRLGPGNTPFAGGNLSLFQSFFNPSTITEAGSLDAVLRGLAYQESNEVDTQTIDGVRNLLFGGTSGRDLIALNIQRGRDHGLPDYNAMRQEYGLPALTSFSEITSDPALAAALELAYGGDIDDVDAWIGMFSEDHVYGSLGETAAAIFIDQFTRLRDADRFFYLNDPDLTQDDLAFLGTLRLSDIIRLNTGATDIQNDIFFTVPTPGALAVLGLAGIGIAPRRRRA